MTDPNEVVIRLRVIGRYAKHLEHHRITPGEALDAAEILLRQAKEHAG